MTDTMIDRVAKAICRASNCPWRSGVGNVPVIENNGVKWVRADMDAANDQWRKLARAAIAAMRDPIPEMLGLLLGETGPFSVDQSGEFYGSGANLAENWNAAIDAALEGK